MQVIALVGRKRGAGKTTLAIELAVCAGDALILDLDPRHPVVDWSQRRDRQWPVVEPLDVDLLPEALEWARDQGYAWTFVDVSAQARPEDVRATIAAADLTLIPSRPGSADLGALGEMAHMVQGAGATSAIALNACIPNGGGIRGALLQQAFSEAKRYGLAVSPYSVAERTAFAEAFLNGSTVVETDPDGKAAADVLALWDWLTEEANLLAA
jgi:chromosome partitioning protein